MGTVSKENEYSTCIGIVRKEAYFTTMYLINKNNKIKNFGCGQTAVDVEKDVIVLISEGSNSEIVERVFPGCYTDKQILAILVNERIIGKPFLESIRHLFPPSLTEEEIMITIAANLDTYIDAGIIK